MAKIHLTVACGDYDRTKALSEGVVQPEGIDFNYLKMEPEELFWRMAQYQEFDASEFSLAAYEIFMGRGDDRFVAIPVFPSKSFRHSAVFINRASGIKRPEDLKGKRIGVPDYTMTASVWQRGILQHDHGVHPTDCQWFIGGLDEPGRKQRVATDPVPHLRIEEIQAPKTLGQMLAEGEVDCLVGAREPRCFREGDPRVGRLWPNFKEVEKDYYRRTGIFPIMHTIVIKRSIYEKHPWVAQSLFKAFDQARKLCIKQMTSHDALRYALPWLMDHVRETQEVLGEDFWSYGLEPNRKSVEALMQFLFEQGLARTVVPAEKLFAVETLRQSKI
jgi:4,5-dihydroxyphthalate decarboxylase